MNMRAKKTTVLSRSYGPSHIIDTFFNIYFVNFNHFACTFFYDFTRATIIGATCTE